MLAPKSGASTSYTIVSAICLVERSNIAHMAEVTLENIGFGRQVDLDPSHNINKLCEAKIIVDDKINITYDIMRRLCIIKHLAHYPLIIQLGHAKVTPSTFLVRIASETADATDDVIEFMQTPYSSIGISDYYDEKILIIIFPGYLEIIFNFENKSANIAYHIYSGEDFDHLLLLVQWILKHILCTPDIITGTTFAHDMADQYQRILPKDIVAIIHDYVVGGFTIWNQG